MSYRLSLLVAASAALFVSPLLFGAKGGGHGGGHGGGGGGHAGGHGGGHSSGGAGSSGHSIVHSPGHSIGHIFGHSPGRRASAVEKNPNSPTFNPARTLPVAHNHIWPRRRMFHANRLFGSGYCPSFRFSWRNFLFPDEFDCFGSSLLFDPFFYGGPSNTYFWSDSLADTAENDLQASTEEPDAAAPLPSDVGQPVVLLQLLDGPMYGLKHYWLEGTELHYVTTYGGENSVPLVRIDFAKTIQLNAERGIRFDVTRNFPNP